MCLQKSIETYYQTENMISQVLQNELDISVELVLEV